MVCLEVLTAVAPPPLPPDWAKYWDAKSSEEILAELLPMLEGMGVRPPYHFIRPASPFGSGVTATTSRVC